MCMSFAGEEDRRINRVCRQPHEMDCRSLSPRLHIVSHCHAQAATQPDVSRGPWGMHHIQEAQGGITISSPDRQQKGWGGPLGLPGHQLQVGSPQSRPPQRPEACASYLQKHLAHALHCQSSRSHGCSVAELDARPSLLAAQLCL